MIKNISNERRAYDSVDEKTKIRLCEKDEEKKFASYRVKENLQIRFI